MTYKGVLLEPVRLPSETSQALAHEIIFRQDEWNILGGNSEKYSDEQLLAKVIDEFYENLKRF